MVLVSTELGNHLAPVADTKDPWSHAVHALVSCAVVGLTSASSFLLSWASELRFPRMDSRGRFTAQSGSPHSQPHSYPSSDQMVDSPMQSHSQPCEGACHSFTSAMAFPNFGLLCIPRQLWNGLFLGFLSFKGRWTGSSRHPGEAAARKLWHRLLRNFCPPCVPGSAGESITFRSLSHTFPIPGDLLRSRSSVVTM